MSDKRIHTFETFCNKEEESGGIIISSCSREVKLSIDRLTKKGYGRPHIDDRWELYVYVHNNRYGGERTVADMKGSILGKIQWLPNTNPIERPPFMPIDEANTLCIHTSRGYIHVIVKSRHSGRNPIQITVQINGKQYSKYTS
jgi:hypothetical protein